jgi:hypothetical protein
MNGYILEIFHSKKLKQNTFNKTFAKKQEKQMSKEITHEIIKQIKQSSIPNSEILSNIHLYEEYKSDYVKLKQHLTPISETHPNLSLKLAEKISIIMGYNKENITHSSEVILPWLCENNHIVFRCPSAITNKTKIENNNEDIYCQICNSLGSNLAWLIPLWNKDNKKSIFEVSPNSRYECLITCENNHTFKSKANNIWINRMREYVYCETCKTLGIKQGK